MAAFFDAHGSVASSILDLIDGERLCSMSMHRSDELDDILANYRSLDRGEVAGMLLAREQEVSILLSDDVKAMRNLRSLAGDIEVHLSTYIIARSVLSGTISKQEAMVSLDRIARHRTWIDAPIFEMAKTYIKDL